MMTAPTTPIRTAEDLRGRRVVVLGLARSGVAATRFLADAGAVVAAYDRRPASELAEAIAALGAARYAWRSASTRSTRRPSSSTPICS